MSEDGTGRPDAPDPDLWSTQYGLKQAAARLRNALFEEDSIKRTFAAQDRVDKLEAAVTRGKDARRMLASEFWTRDIEPLLKSEAVLRPWNPKEEGAFAFMKLVSQYIFGSGQARVAIKLMETLHRWDRDGAEADKMLTVEAEKRKKASEARDRARA